MFRGTLLKYYPARHCLLKRFGNETRNELIEVIEREKNGAEESDADSGMSTKAKNDQTAASSRPIYPRDCWCSFFPVVARDGAYRK